MSEPWEWITCRDCGSKTIKAKFCMKCGSPLSISERIRYSYSYNVTFLGEKGVGKTSIIEKISETADSVTRPSFGKIVASFILQEAEVIFSFSETDSTKLPNQTDAVAVVFDINSRLTFLKSIRYLSALEEIQPRPLIFLLGNKSDKAGERKVEVSEALEISKARGVNYFEVSATTGSGLPDFHKTLIKQLLLKKLEDLRSVLKT